MKLKYLFGLAFVSLFIPVSPAMGSKVDSLIALIGTVEDDSTKIQMLSDICTEFIDTDTANARIYCERMLAEAAGVSSPYGKGVAFRTAGTYYSVAADYGKSLDFYKKAIDIFSRLPGRQPRIAYGETLLDFASVFHHRGDFETALSVYLEADSILSGYNDYSTLLILYNDISDIYLKLGRTDKSIVYVNKINSIIDSVGDRETRSRYYISHANMLTYQGKYDEAIRFYEMARAIAEPAHKYNVLTNWAYNYGFMLSQRGMYDEALAYYEKSEKYAEMFGSKYDQCDAMYKIGLMHYYAHRYERANGILLKALDFAVKIDSKVLVRNVLDGLTYLEADMGHYKAAYNYLQRYVDVTDQLFTQSDQRQINFLNARYEAAARKAEIQRLTNERKIQVLEIGKRNNIEYFLSATLALVLLSGYFVQRYYRTRKKMIEQNSQLQAQRIKELEREKQLAAVQYALQGEEKERSRLARDLHDGLGGLLSGAKMTFASFKEHYLNGGEESEYFKQAFDLLGKSITELQRVAHNMMPQALVSGNIRDAVSEFCEKLNGTDSLSLSFRFFGHEEKVASEYRITTYRVVQELVNNVIKHSGATEALVQLVQEKNRLSVSVQDNGRGFNPTVAQISGGHGLSNIRMRVESLGGHFDIDSTYGKGTEITFEFEGMSARTESLPS